MNTFLRVDINIAGMILLAIILFVALGRLELRDKLNRAFIITSAIIVLELFFETASCVVNGRQGGFASVLSNLLHICLFATAPVLSFFWYCFVRRWIGIDCDHRRAVLVLLLFPLALNAVLSILSPFFGFIFYLDGENIYHRGDFFVLSSVVTYMYMVLSIAVVLKNRKKLIKDDFYPMLLLGVLPMIGGIIQSLVYGVLLIWSCAAFTLVLVYNYLQQRMINVDKLTGAWTRDSFEYYISRKFKNCGEKHGVIFMDFDGLKSINDSEGHIEGDLALKSAVGIIRGEIKKTDIIARFGGDEFVIIIDCEDATALEAATERIKAAFDSYNESSGKPYKIECSLGADIMCGGYDDIYVFLRHVDGLMYKNKKRKREAKT